MRNKNRKNNKMNSHSDAVKNFILDFYKILSEFTKEQKPIDQVSLERDQVSLERDQVSLERRRADTLARLIYGDEICAALCIKETQESINLYIATNHKNESKIARQRVSEILPTLKALGSRELPKTPHLDSNVMKTISLPFLRGQYKKDVRRQYKELSEQKINEKIEKMVDIADKLIDQLINDYNAYLGKCNETKKKSFLRVWYSELTEKGNIENVLYSHINKEDHHLDSNQIKYSTDKIKIFMRDYIKLRNFLGSNIVSYEKLEKALNNTTPLQNEIECEEIIAVSSPLPAQKFIEKTINHQGKVISTKEIEIPAEEEGFIILKEPKKLIHAEMRLLKELYPGFIKNKDPEPFLYFGISKLCCPQCNLIMKNFFPDIMVTRGHHNNLAKWPLDDSFFVDATAKKNFLTLLFGDELYRKYSDLCANDKNICIELIQDIGSNEIYKWLEDDLEKLKIQKIPVRTGKTDAHTATDDIESPIRIRIDIEEASSGPSYNTMLANLPSQYDAIPCTKESSERVQNPNTYLPSQSNDFFIEDGKAAGKEEEEESFPKKRKREFSHEN